MYRRRRAGGGGHDSNAAARCAAAHRCPCPIGDTCADARGDDGAQHPNGDGCARGDAGPHGNTGANGAATVHAGPDADSASHAGRADRAGGFPSESEHDSTGPADDSVLEGIPELRRAFDAHV